MSGPVQTQPEAASGTPLPLRRRGDLVVRRIWYQGQATWVVKDPLGLRYFRFQDQEYDVLQMLDGQTTLEQIYERLQAKYKNQRFSRAEVLRFVGTLHQNGLVVSTVPGQGPLLWHRRGKRQRQQWMERFANILAIRFRGVDPDRLLDGLNPWFGWFFSRTAVVLVLLFALVALGLVLVHFDQFQRRLPSFHEFFQLSNWPWILLALSFAKVLHELGHGLSCKRLGGECHEIGVMFLVLTPCLYCNVSDSWLLPNKWHRAAIGAAGMYVEIFLASVATFLWWFSEPDSWIHLFSLNLMLVCSVSTLLFNGNPLLRFDGYYVLSDVLDVPNLAQRSSTALRRVLARLVLGLPPRPDPFQPRRHVWLFVLYSIASTVYRWLVVFGILWFLTEVFRPYGLEVIGYLLALLSLVALVGIPLWRFVKFVRTPGALEEMKKLHVFFSLAVLGAVVAFLALVPLPYRVDCPLEVQPRASQTVYVVTPGQLASVEVAPGQRVQAGQVLARLENLDLDIQIAQLKHQLAQKQVQLQSLQRLRFSDPTAAAALPEVRETIAALEAQLKEKLQDRQRLVIRAPAAGVFIPPPWADPVRQEEQLPRWAGYPLEQANLNTWLEAGVVLGHIATPGQWEAVLVVDQSEVELVRLGDPVEMMLDAYPGRVISAQVDRLSSERIETASLRLSAQGGGELETRQGPQGTPRPVHTAYQAVCYFRPEPDMKLRLGLRGHGRVAVRPMTCLERFWRFVQQTFRFR